VSIIALRNFGHTRTHTPTPVLGGWLHRPAAVKPYDSSIPCRSKSPAKQCPNRPSWPIGNTKMSSQYMFSHEDGAEIVLSRVLDSETGDLEEVSRDQLEMPILPKSTRCDVECCLFLDAMHGGTRTSRTELCRAIGLDFARLDTRTRRDFIAAFINRIEIMQTMFFDSHKDLKNLIQSYRP